MANATPEKILPIWRQIFALNTLDGIEKEIGKLQKLVDAEEDPDVKKHGQEILSSLQTDWLSTWMKCKANLPLSRYFLKKKIMQATKAAMDKTVKYELGSAQKQALRALIEVLDTTLPATDEIRSPTEYILDGGRSFDEIAMVAMTAVVQRADAANRLDPGVPSDDSIDSRLEEIFQAIKNDPEKLARFWVLLFENVIVPMTVFNSKPLPSLELGPLKHSLVERLGSGGFGSVFMTTVYESSGSRRITAVKKMTLKDERDAGYYRRECEGLKKAGVHPNIVQFLGAEAVNLGRPDEHHIFIEYVSGYSIYQILKQTEFPEVWCIAVMRQVLNGVGHLHDRGIVHRDLKGPNILVKVNGLIKVADFGLSKAVKDIPPSGGENVTAAGTRGYIAPEIRSLQGGYSTLSDVWSLGCLVLELFHRKWPSGKFVEYVREFPFPANKDRLASIINPNNTIPELVIRFLTNHVLVSEAKRWSVKQFQQCAWFT